MSRTLSTYLKGTFSVFWFACAGGQTHFGWCPSGVGSDVNGRPVCAYVALNATDPDLPSPGSETLQAAGTCQAPTPYAIDIDDSRICVDSQDVTREELSPAIGLSIARRTGPAQQAQQWLLGGWRDPSGQHVLCIDPGGNIARWDPLTVGSVKPSVYNFTNCVTQDGFFICEQEGISRKIYWGVDAERLSIQIENEALYHCPQGASCIRNYIRVSDVTCSP